GGSGTARAAAAFAQRRRAGIAAIAAGRARLDVVLDAAIRVPHARLALALRDLLDRSPADHGAGLLLENVRLLRIARGVVLSLDQQPVGLLVAGPAAHAHEMPGAGELVSVQQEVEASLPEAFVRIVFGRPAAAVPDQHGAAAVFALRDGALERVVLDRMILDL